MLLMMCRHHPQSHSAQQGVRVAIDQDVHTAETVSPPSTPSAVAQGVEDAGERDAHAAENVSYQRIEVGIIEDTISVYQGCCHCYLCPNYATI
jgi:hypothetical protein